MKKTFFKNILAGTLLVMIFLPTILLAQTGGTTAPPTGGTTAPPPVKFNIKISNPFSGGNDLYAFIKTVIKEILMPIGGVIAVLMIMYAGFLYVTAGGNETKIKKAHEALLYSAIGAAILLGAWVIAEAIGGTIKQLQL